MEKDVRALTTDELTDPAFVKSIFDNYKKDALYSILENAKGDMEPYVYESLTKLIK